MEHSTNVKAVKTRQSCDEENCDGEMEFTGEKLLSYPAQYIHKCNKCSLVRRFRKKYPVVEFVDCQ